MDSDELFYNPGWFASTEKSIFSWDFKTTDLGAERDLIGGAVFQMDPHVYIHERSVYNYLDLLGDVGGLKEALYLISSFILFLCGQQDRI